MTLPLEPPGLPRDWADAVESARAAMAVEHRPGALSLQELPPPRRLSPYALAVSATVGREGDPDDDLATGRFVVLHDPAGQPGWGGDTRVVAFVQASVDPEMAADPALGDVGWSWLTDALLERGAEHTAAGGTVTRTVSATFGQIEADDTANDVEVRASWTPLHGEEGALDLGPHLRAWCDLLRATAGLPPPGVSALRPS